MLICVFVVNRGGECGEIDADQNVQKSDGNGRDGPGEFKGGMNRFDEREEGVSLLIRE